ncbi:pentatricopeptide repeat-containing protein At5g66500, mitochondrial-like [Malania oleifera]|uniref:pentatricopeptide repeat-containing protein At5g66500, mitochondrial-like n=1 Tax=Malania oleifera TaxID=397392 RepID=UPI0025ADE367|nr:pentatricopeptide repeat-containing protein At5g66500, mitochondrial-like [Malania oleifera]XP_057969561.1 pentatricopeptide repeat-containing protein At5g66500, mitochondrial-like [Malania oleifera]
MFATRKTVVETAFCFVCPAKTSNKTRFSVRYGRHELHNVHTHCLLDETPHRYLYSFNSLLASYVRNDDASAAWSLFRHMLCTFPHLSAHTFTPILGACSALPDPRRGLQVHALMIKTGLDSDIAKTALMDMYSKYGHLDDSVRVFDDMSLKDVVSWNALLSSFLRHGLPKEALNAFEAMRKEGVEFSQFTLCSVLKACDFLKAFRQGKQVHGLVVVMSRDLVVLSTALIDFYSNIGLVEEAVKVFSYLKCRKDEVICNSLISGCVQNKKYDVAFSIMSKMTPNKIALTNGLAACSENSDLWVGKQIHNVAIRLGLVYDTQLCNALLDMYAKCGKILNARSVFDGVLRRDVVSWTSMIDAYGSHGHGLEAIYLFEKMGEEGSGVSPNPVTFLAVLSACRHSGLVEQGQECFVSVQHRYGMDPGPEHYACLIDILGRAGQIEDVWCVFDEMIKKSVMPTAVVWATLLNACRLSQDVSRGEFAAEHLLELEPHKTGNYVLLSNFYAAIERWDLVDKLRIIMRKKGLVKEVGSSWVTAAGCHEDDEVPSILSI